jgi:PAS domain S-box-containing protein
MTPLTNRNIVPAPDIESEALSNHMVAALLDQSMDCIKLIATDGTVQYMNANGLCAMEIDRADAVKGRAWADLWPADSKLLIESALARAANGQPHRFEAFCPTAKGAPRWWDVSVSQVRGSSGQVLGYLSVSRDVTAALVAKEAAEVAAAEMKHRLKNSYAMIASLLSALAKGTPEREQFVREIRDRLQALGVAQTLFVSREHAPCNIGELLPALLQPFSTVDCPVECADLPCATVDQGQADALALVIGELSVNSSKHGAISAAGSIHVTADLRNGHLIIHWHERSSRPVAAHDRTGGQGLRLIKRILAARDAEIEFDWKDDGLDATILLRKVAAGPIQ